MYKYQFNKLLSTIPKERRGQKGNRSMQDVLEDLSEFGISKFQFYRDRKIKIEDRKSIPGDRLVKYANYFQVNIDELMSSPSAAYKSLKAEVGTPRWISPLI